MPQNSTTAALAAAAIAFIAPISTYEHGGGGGEGRRWSSPYNNRHYVDPNSYWYGAENGYYGAVVVDPDAGSGAGMVDDSDQLYQSYLNHFGTFGD